MTSKMIRKGAKVRYTGPDPRLRELWKDGTYIVTRKTGDSAIGYFPTMVCGTIHLESYSIPTEHLELAK